jgi:L-threonylcarbamoyladenylate synthase
MNKSWSKAKEILKNGGIAVLPVDTMLYGIVSRALDKSAVEKVYKAKGRDDGKPCIVLFTKWAELKDFGIELSGEQVKKANAFWPGKVSVVLETNKKSSQKYLHRGSGTIAFRMVGKKHLHLHKLLSITGPLIAPSANPQGILPAKTIRQAKKYFGSAVDLYIAGGKRNGLPSTLITFEKEKIKILREGAVVFRRN